MTDITWGAAIPVNGVKPVWLRDDDKISTYCGEGMWSNYAPCHAAISEWWDNVSPNEIRLPSNHPAYIAIENGFEPWAGSPEQKAPNDWDGGLVLRRNGDIDAIGCFPASWSHIANINPHRDVIGYRKRQPKVEDVPQWACDRQAALELEGGPFAFARYIAKHEEPPVDPLYEALHAVVELGRYNTREQTELLRGELKKRGLEIREIER